MFDKVSSVIRNIREKNGSLWIGSSIFHPNKLKNNKLIILLNKNKNIGRIVNDKCGKLRAGDLIEIKKQIYKATFTENSNGKNDCIIRYEIKLNDNANYQSSNFGFLYISDPLNINDHRSCCLIKNGQIIHDYENNEFENNLLNHYLDFNDHVDYAKIHNRKQNKKKKKKAKLNRKRSFNEMSKNVNEIDIENHENHGNHRYQINNNNNDNNEPDLQSLEPQNKKRKLVEIQPDDHDEKKNVQNIQEMIIIDDHEENETENAGSISPELNVGINGKPNITKENMLNGDKPQNEKLNKSKVKKKRSDKEEMDASLSSQDINQDEDDEIKENGHQNEEKQKSKDDNVEVILINDDDDNEDYDTLKKEHLYIPDKIKSHPNKLLQFTDDNIIRIVYDSEENDDNTLDRNEPHRDKNIKDKCVNVEIDSFVLTLLKNIENESDQFDNHWIISDCTRYWINRNS